MSFIENNHPTMFAPPSDNRQLTPPSQWPESFQLLAQEQIFSYPELLHFANSSLESFLQGVESENVLGKIRPYYADILAKAFQTQGGTQAAISTVLNYSPEAKVELIMEAEGNYLEDQLLPHLDKVFGNKLINSQRARRDYVMTLMDSITRSTDLQPLSDKAISAATNLIFNEQNYVNRIIKEVGQQLDFEKIQIRVAKTLIDRSPTPFISNDEISAVSYYLQDTWQYNAGEAKQSLPEYIKGQNDQSINNDALLEVSYRISPNGLLNEEEYISEAFGEGIEPIIGDHQKLGLTEGLLQNGAVPDDISLKIIIQRAARSDLAPRIIALMLENNPNLKIDDALNRIPNVWTQTYTRASELHNESGQPLEQNLYKERMNLATISQQLINAGANINSQNTEGFSEMLEFAALLPGAVEQTSNEIPLYKQLIYTQGVPVNPEIITQLINHPNLQNPTKNFEVLRELVVTRQIAVPDTALDAVINHVNDSPRMPFNTAQLFIQEGFRFKNTHVESLIEQAAGSHIVELILSTDHTIDLNNALEKTLQRWQNTPTPSATGIPTLDNRINAVSKQQYGQLYKIAGQLINNGAQIPDSNLETISQMRAAALENDDAEYSEMFNPRTTSGAEQRNLGPSQQDIIGDTPPPENPDEPGTSSVLNDFPNSPGSFDSSMATSTNGHQPPNGIIDTHTDAQSSHDGSGNNGNKAITAVAGDAPEPNKPFQVINGEVVISGISFSELDLGEGSLQNGDNLFGVSVGLPGLPEYTPAPRSDATPATEHSIPVADTSTQSTPQTSQQQGGVTIGGQLGNDKGKTAAELGLDPSGKLPGPEKAQAPDPTPGYGEGVNTQDLNQTNTRDWGGGPVMPDLAKLTPEGFPQQDKTLEDILNPEGPSGARFKFPPGNEEIPAAEYQAVIKTLPALQQISVAEYSQLSSADQKNIISRAVEYQSLPADIKANTTLLQYADSGQTNPAQRSQMLGAQQRQSAHTAQQMLSGAQSSLSDSTLKLLDTRIEVLQANTATLKQQTQALTQNNASRQSALATPTTTDSATAAFIKPDIKPGQTPPASNSTSAPQVNSQTSPIPRFMVINTAKGPQLMENLSNGKTQMLPYPIPADTPITRQGSDGGWRNVPDAYAIGAKNLLDTLLLQSTVKMLNGGNAVQTPGAQSVPQAPNTIPRPAF